MYSPQVRGELVHAPASWLRGTSLMCHGKKKKEMGNIGCWRGRHGAGLQPAPALPSPLSHGFNACLEIQYLGFRLPL